MEDLKIPELLEEPEKSGEPKKKIVTEVGIVLAYNEQQFREYCALRTLGYLMSMSNYFKILYNRVTGTKNDLVDKVNKKEIELNEENQRTLNGLYHYLMQIEQKIFILKELIANSFKSPESQK